MEKVICKKCAHSCMSYVTLICQRVKREKTFYSTGQVITLYQTCDSANHDGECSEFVLKPSLLSRISAWWMQ